MKAELKCLIIEALGLAVMFAVGFYFKDLPAVSVLLNACIGMSMGSMMYRILTDRELERSFMEKSRNDYAHEQLLINYKLSGTRITWSQWSCDGRAILSEKYGIHVFLLHPRYPGKNPGALSVFDMVVYKDNSEGEMDNLFETNIWSDDYLKFELELLRQIKDLEEHNWVYDRATMLSIITGIITEICDTESVPGEGEGAEDHA